LSKIIDILKLILKPFGFKLIYGNNNKIYLKYVLTHSDVKYLFFWRRFKHISNKIINILKLTLKLVGLKLIYENNNKFILNMLKRLQESRICS